MSINQQIQLKIKGDASQALQTFDKVKKSATDMGNHLKTKSGLLLPNTGEMAKVAKDMDLLARESKKVARGYDKAARSAKELGKQVGFMGKMMKMGGSGSRNMMFAIGNLGETFAIARNGGYQMRFLLHQLMDSMMMLGPMGLAVGGAVAGIGVLSRSMFSAKESMEQVAIATVDLNEVVKQRLGGDFQKATIIVGDLEKQIRDFGKTSLEVKRSLAQETIFNLEQEVDAMQQQAPHMLKMVQDFEKQLTAAKQKEAELRSQVTIKETAGGMRTVGPVAELARAGKTTSMLQEQYDKVRLQLELFNSDIKINTIELTKQQQAFMKIDPLLDEYSKKVPDSKKADEDKKKSKKALSEAERENIRAIRAASQEISRSESEKQRFGKVLTEEERSQYYQRIADKGNFLMEMERLGTPAEKEAADIELSKLLTEEYKRDLDERLNAAKSAEKNLTKFKKNEEKLRLKADRDAKREKERLERESQRKTEGYVRDGTAVLVGLATEGARIMVTEEKDKNAMIKQMFLETVGSQLVALGTRLTIEGAAKLITTSGAAGYGELAIGASAIATGTAMGAEGARTGAQIQAKQERRREQERERDRTRRSARRGGGTFGGTRSESATPTVVNISYGVGPQPEQTAQAVLDALAFGNRRGMRGRA